MCKITKDGIRYKRSTMTVGYQLWLYWRIHKQHAPGLSDERKANIELGPPWLRDGNVKHADS